MADRILALVFGVCLVAGGMAALSWHVKSWRRHRADAQASDGELSYYRRQFSRRILATGLFVLIGILLPIGNLPVWEDYPGGWAVFWMAVLGLTMYVLLLGFFDLLSTRAHSRGAMQRLQSLRKKRQELEQEIARIRSRSPNGRPPNL